MLPVSVLTFSPATSAILPGNVLSQIIERRLGENGQPVNYLVLAAPILAAESEWAQVVRGKYVRVPCFCYASRHNSPVGLGVELGLRFEEALGEACTDFGFKATRIVLVASDRFVRSRQGDKTLRGVLLGMVAEVQT